MSERSTDVDDTGQSSHPESREKFVYLMPEQAAGHTSDNEISLSDLWGVVWRGKWLIIIVTAMFAAGSVAYALLATKWYRAEVLLAPAEAESTPSVPGQLGGLVALAGVSVGGGESAEAVATLKSRDLAREFIQKNDLLTILLYEEWDAAAQRWRGRDGRTPDMRDAVKLFHEQALTVREDRETQLVTVAVEWIDPDLAADWAATLVQLANERLRQRALKDAETNVAYLRAEIAATSVVTLQQSISRLLETEMQKLMLAKGNEEFSFRIVDTAEPARRPSRPRPALVSVGGTLLGGAFAVFLVFVRSGLRSD